MGAAAAAEAAMGGGVEGDAAKKAHSDYCVRAPLSLLLGEGASPLQPI